MNDTESEQQPDLDIDEQADLLEEEIEQELAANRNDGYLLPWLVPAAIAGAFIIAIVLAWM